MTQDVSTQVVVGDVVDNPTMSWRQMLASARANKPAPAPVVSAPKTPFGNLAGLVDKLTPVVMRKRAGANTRVPIDMGAGPGLSRNVMGAGKGKPLTPGGGSLLTAYGAAMAHYAQTGMVPDANTLAHDPACAGLAFASVGVAVSDAKRMVRALAGVGLRIVPAGDK